MISLIKIFKRIVLKKLSFSPQREAAIKNCLESTEKDKIGKILFEAGLFNLEDVENKKRNLDIAISFFIQSMNQGYVLSEYVLKRFSRYFDPKKLKSEGRRGHILEMFLIKRIPLSNLPPVIKDFVISYTDIWSGGIEDFIRHTRILTQIVKIALKNPTIFSPQDLKILASYYFHDSYACFTTGLFETTLTFCKAAKMGHRTSEKLLEDKIIPLFKEKIRTGDKQIITDSLNYFRYYGMTIEAGDKELSCIESLNKVIINIVHSELKHPQRIENNAKAPVQNIPYISSAATTSISAAFNQVTNAYTTYVDILDYYTLMENSPSTFLTRSWDICQSRQFVDGNLLKDQKSKESHYLSIAANALESVSDLQRTLYKTPINVFPPELINIILDYTCKIIPNMNLVPR